MKTNYQLQNIAAASQDQAFIDESARLTAVTSSPGVGQFLSSIIGRASIPDIANDFRASLGIERIPVQQIMLLQNEFGPNGEPVYGALNDTRGLIRFVGPGLVVFNNVNGQGVYGVPGDYVEISFYGTGLNLVTHAALALACEGTVTVDGVSAGTFVESTTSSSGVLGGRNYSIHAVKNVVEGLSLGLHTVKITVTSNYIDVQGFEILNANASGLVNVNPGTAYYRGNKIKNTAADSIAYNTGVTGTKGGRVVRYFTGTDAPTQAVTVVDTTAFYLTNANHANEEVARTYNWREFGAGRYSPADDFSLYASGSSARAFTLEDGTTTLVGTVGGVVSESVYTDISQFVTLTFVGTGVDVDLGAGAGGAKTDTVQAWIDGSNVGNMPTTNNTNVTIKVASGLAYGTHTLKLLRTVNSIGIISYKGFKVYQPKKPALPVGAIEIADYNVMATFDGTAATGTAVADNVQIPQGTLTKMCTREFVYTGAGWTISAASGAYLPGFFCYTSNNSQPFQHTFFGTGISLHMQASSGGTYDFTVTIDGSLNASGVARANASNLTGGSYRSTSTTSSQPCRVEFTGLSAGNHTIVATTTSGSLLIVQALNIITPIHSMKSNLYADLQNTLPVGSQSLMDSRSISPQPPSLSAPKAWAQAIGVASGPTTNAAFPAHVPMPDMSVTVKTSGGPIRITFIANVTLGSASFMYTAVYVDGIMVFQPLSQYINTATATMSPTISIVVPVSAGTHKIDGYWSVLTGGTGTAQLTNRILTVEEK